MDEAFSRHDLSDAAGLTDFLQAHHVALVTAMPRLAESGFGFGHLPDLIADDLAMLGFAAPQSTAPALSALPGHGLGYAYVVAGSSLGARVLNRRRLRSHDPAVLAAGTYLTGNIGETAWPALRARLEAMVADGPHQDKIVDGALSCFEIFGQTATAHVPGDA